MHNALKLATRFLDRSTYSTDQDTYTRREQRTEMSTTLPAGAFQERCRVRNCFPAYILED